MTAGGEFDFELRDTPVGPLDLVEKCSTAPLGWVEMRVGICFLDPAGGCGQAKEINPC